jgi:Xaa-Pro dipeptidase
MISSSMREVRVTFERAEYEARLLRLRAAMREHSVDAVLVDEPEALLYYAGHFTSRNLYRALLVPVEGAPVMVVRQLDALPFSAGSWIGDTRGFRDWEDPYQAVAGAAQERGLASGRIGFDATSYCLTVDDLEGLRAALPRAALVPIRRLLWELRVVKSSAEIEILRGAAMIADQALRQTIASAREGADGPAMRRAAQAAFGELGADFGRVGVISIGRGWDFLHVDIGRRKLSRGDVLHIEVVPKVSSYVAKVMRSTVIGSATAEQRRAAALLAAAQDSQMAAMRPGMLARDVDAIAREAVLATGLRSEFDNITGYTLGLNVDANPRISEFTRTFHPHAEWVLESGMVFHMYISAQGLAFSETVLVTDKGAERLTRLEREVFER